MSDEIIVRIPLFDSLPHDEIENLFSTLRRIELPPGAVLFHEGDHGDRFYIVIDGQLDVVKALGTVDERLLSTRGPGECFGEMSLLDPDRLRTAAVRTRTSTQLLEMTEDEFAALLHRRPAVAFEMARTLCRCLHDADNATIRDLQEKNRQLAQAYEDLQNAQARLIEKERLDRELQVAREIQESILPRSLPSFWGYDFGARMVPARAVGGDFFDFIPLGNDSLGIAVGDVSDKGVPSAIFMAMTRSLVRAEAGRAASPRQALEGVNKHLLDMNDAGMFVTVLYGVLHSGTRRFNYVRAGHPLPILCSGQGHVTVPPNTEGQPLAILPEPALDEQSVELSPGSTMLIYTDGVTEAMDPRGELFGSKRLHEVLRAHHHASAQALCDRLVETVMDYQGEVPHHDDVTLVAVSAPE